PSWCTAYGPPSKDDETAVHYVSTQSDTFDVSSFFFFKQKTAYEISTGWSNHTPWNTHREETEEKLGERIEAMAKQIPDSARAIFNLHCPPYRSGLDEAPAIDSDLKLMHGGRALRPVGSTAVRHAIA